MKRLLAYLLIVFGLGLIFNVNAFSKTVYCEVVFINDYGETVKTGPKDWSKISVRAYDVEPVYFVKDKCYFAFTDRVYDGKKYISKTIKVDHPQITFKKYVELLTSYRFRKGASSGIYGSGGYWVKVDIARSIVREFEKNNFDTTYLISLLESFHKIARKDLPETKFVAKKEPSQKQNVAEKEMYMCIYSSNDFLTNFIVKFVLPGRVFDAECIKKYFIYKDKSIYQKIVSNSRVYKTSNFISTDEQWKIINKKNFNSLVKNHKTQIAESKPKKKPEASNNDQASLDEERRKIEEEKKKIEEEKRKIAEAKKKREEEEKKRKEANAKLYVIGSGTGFFVSSSGHAVSNEHVVGICRKVATKIDGEKVFFNILKTDQVNDLGLIKGDYTSPNFLSIKSDGAEFGEDIVAFGYPLRGILSSSVKLTRGIVSSLSGLNDNYSEIQIDAAIQPGNSGGPVLNMEGQVVGVASSGLNKLAMIEEAEYIPENVNFAVAAPTLHNFLKSNGVNTKNKPLKINNTKELAKIGRPATIQLFCLNTKAKHEELKNKKKHSDVLLEKVIELN
tara:strand:- start:118 stop:1800 length:1683 start_codon:yes stop_codon:yes gene_type:complete